MENTNEAVNAAPAEEALASRVIAGLQEGRLVNYLMRDKSVRPLLIVNARKRDGLVNGVLFFDGPNDNGNHVVPQATEHSGFIPYTVRHLVAVPFDDTAEQVGSWHWPQKQAVVAAGLDNAALEQIVDALTESVMQRAAVLSDRNVALVNEKLAQHVDTTNKLLDSHSEMVKDELAKAVMAITQPPLPTSPVPTPEQLAAREPVPTVAEAITTENVNEPIEVQMGTAGVDGTMSSAETKADTQAFEAAHPDATQVDVRPQGDNATQSSS